MSFSAKPGREQDPGSPRHLPMAGHVCDHDRRAGMRHCRRSRTASSLFGVLLREFNQQRHAVVCRHFDGETV
jgi:hypothetical protein